MVLVDGKDKDSQLTLRKDLDISFGSGPMARAACQLDMLTYATLPVGRVMRRNPYFLKNFKNMVLYILVGILREG